MPRQVQPSSPPSHTPRLDGDTMPPPSQYPNAYTADGARLHAQPSIGGVASPPTSTSLRQREARRQAQSTRVPEVRETARQTSRTRPQRAVVGDATPTSTPTSVSSRGRQARTRYRPNQPAHDARAAAGDAEDDDGPQQSFGECEIPWADFVALYRSGLPSAVACGSSPTLYEGSPLRQDVSSSGQPPNVDGQSSDVVSLADRLQPLDVAASAIQEPIDQPQSVPAVPKGAVVVAPPHLSRDLVTGTAAHALLCSEFGINVRSPPRDTVDHSSIRGGQVWDRVFTLLTTHCSFALPEPRRELLRNGNQRSVLELFAQVRAVSRVAKLKRQSSLTNEASLNAHTSVAEEHDHQGHAGGQRRAPRAGRPAVTTLSPTMLDQHTPGGHSGGNGSVRRSQLRGLSNGPLSKSGSSRRSDSKSTVDRTPRSAMNDGNSTARGRDANQRSSAELSSTPVAAGLGQQQQPSAGQLHQTPSRQLFTFENPNDVVERNRQQGANEEARLAPKLRRGRTTVVAPTSSSELRSSDQTNRTPSGSYPASSLRRSRSQATEVSTSRMKQQQSESGAYDTDATSGGRRYRRAPPRGRSVSPIGAARSPSYRRLHGRETSETRRRRARDSDRDSSNADHRSAMPVSLTPDPRAGAGNSPPPLSLLQQVRRVPSVRRDVAPHGVPLPHGAPPQRRAPAQLGGKLRGLHNPPTVAESPPKPWLAGTGLEREASSSSPLLNQPGSQVLKAGDPRDSKPRQLAVLATDASGTPQRQAASTHVLDRLVPPPQLTPSGAFGDGGPLPQRGLAPLLTSGQPSAGESANAAREGGAVQQPNGSTVRGGAMRGRGAALAPARGRARGGISPFFKEQESSMLAQQQQQQHQQQHQSHQNQQPMYQQSQQPQQQFQFLHPHAAPSPAPVPVRGLGPVSSGLAQPTRALNGSSVPHSVHMHTAQHVHHHHHHQPPHQFSSLHQRRMNPGVNYHLSPLHSGGGLAGRQQVEHGGFDGTQPMAGASGAAVGASAIVANGPMAPVLTHQGSSGDYQQQQPLSAPPASLQQNTQGHSGGQQNGVQHGPLSAPSGQTTPQIEISPHQHPQHGHMYPPLHHQQQQQHQMSPQQLAQQASSGDYAPAGGFGMNPGGVSGDFSQQQHLQHHQHHHQQPGLSRAGSGEFQGGSATLSPAQQWANGGGPGQQLSSGQMSRQPSSMVMSKQVSSSAGDFNNGMMMLRPPSSLFVHRGNGEAVHSVSPPGRQGFSPGQTPPHSNSPAGRSTPAPGVEASAAPTGPPGKQAKASPAKAKSSSFASQVLGGYPSAGATPSGHQSPPPPQNAPPLQSNTGGGPTSGEFALLPHLIQVRGSPPPPPAHHHHQPHGSSPGHAPQQHLRQGHPLQLQPSPQLQHQHQYQKEQHKDNSQLTPQEQLARANALAKELDATTQHVAALQAKALSYPEYFQHKYEGWMADQQSAALDRQISAAADILAAEESSAREAGVVTEVAEFVRIVSSHAPSYAAAEKAERERTGARNEIVLTAEGDLLRTALRKSGGVGASGQKGTSRSRGGGAGGALSTKSRLSISGMLSAASSRRSDGKRRVHFSPDQVPLDGDDDDNSHSYLNSQCEGYDDDGDGGDEARRVPSPLETEERSIVDGSHASGLPTFEPLNSPHQNHGDGDRKREDRTKTQRSGQTSASQNGDDDLPLISVLDTEENWEDHYLTQQQNAGGDHGAAGGLNSSVLSRARVEKQAAKSTATTKRQTERQHHREMLQRRHERLHSVPMSVRVNTEWILEAPGIYDYLRARRRLIAAAVPETLALSVHGAVNVDGRGDDPAALAEEDELTVFQKRALHRIAFTPTMGFFLRRLSRILHTNKRSRPAVSNATSASAVQKRTVLRGENATEKTADPLLDDDEEEMRSSAFWAGKGKLGASKKPNHRSKHRRPQQQSQHSQPKIKTRSIEEEIGEQVQLLLARMAKGDAGAHHGHGHDQHPDAPSSSSAVQLHRERDAQQVRYDDGGVKGTTNEEPTTTNGQPKEEVQDGGVHIAGLGSMAVAPSPIIASLGRLGNGGNQHESSSTPQPSTSTVDAAPVVLDSANKRTASVDLTSPQVQRGGGSPSPRPMKTHAHRGTAEGKKAAGHKKINDAVSSAFHHHLRLKERRDQDVAGAALRISLWVRFKMHHRRVRGLRPREPTGYCQRCGPIVDSLADRMKTVNAQDAQQSESIQDVVKRHAAWMCDMCVKDYAVPDKFHSAARRASYRNGCSGQSNLNPNLPPHRRCELLQRSSSLELDGIGAPVSPAVALELWRELGYLDAASRRTTPLGDDDDDEDDEDMAVNAEKKEREEKATVVRLDTCLVRIQSQLRWLSAHSRVDRRLDFAVLRPVRKSYRKLTAVHQIQAWFRLRRHLRKVGAVAAQRKYQQPNTAVADTTAANAIDVHHDDEGAPKRRHSTAMEEVSASEERFLSMCPKDAAVRSALKTRLLAVGYSSFEGSSNTAIANSNTNELAGSDGSDGDEVDLTSIVAQRKAQRHAARQRRVEKQEALVAATYGLRRRALGPADVARYAVLCCTTCREVIIPQMVRELSVLQRSVAFIQAVVRWRLLWRRRKGNVWQQYLDNGGGAAAWKLQLGRHRCTTCGPVMNAIGERVKKCHATISDLARAAAEVCRDRAVCRAMQQRVIVLFTQQNNAAIFLGLWWRWKLLKKHKLVCPIEAKDYILATVDAELGKEALTVAAFHEILATSTTSVRAPAPAVPSPSPEQPIEGAVSNPNINANANANANPATNITTNAVTRAVVSLGSAAAAKPREGIVHPRYRGMCLRCWPLIFGLFEEVLGAAETDGERWTVTPTAIQKFSSMLCGVCRRAVGETVTRTMEARRKVRFLQERYWWVRCSAPTRRLQRLRSCKRDGVLHLSPTISNQNDLTIRGETEHIGSVVDVSCCRRPSTARCLRCQPILELMDQVLSRGVSESLPMNNADDEGGLLSSLLLPSVVDTVERFVVSLCHRCAIAHGAPRLRAVTARAMLTTLHHLHVECRREAHAKLLRFASSVLPPHHALDRRAAAALLPGLPIAGPNSALAEAKAMKEWALDHYAATVGCRWRYRVQRSRATFDSVCATLRRERIPKLTGVHDTVIAAALHDSKQRGRGKGGRGGVAGGGRPDTKKKNGGATTALVPSSALLPLKQQSRCVTLHLRAPLSSPLAKGHLQESSAATADVVNSGDNSSRQRKRLSAARAQAQIKLVTSSGAQSQKTTERPPLHRRHVVKVYHNLKMDSQGSVEYRCPPALQARYDRRRELCPTCDTIAQLYGQHHLGQGNAHLLSSSHRLSGEAGRISATKGDAGATSAMTVAATNAGDEANSAAKPAAVQTQRKRMSTARRWGYVRAVCNRCKPLLRTVVDIHIAQERAALFFHDRWRWIQFQRATAALPTMGHGPGCSPKCSSIMYAAADRMMYERMTLLLFRDYYVFDTAQLRRVQQFYSLQQASSTDVSAAAMSKNQSGTRQHDQKHHADKTLLLGPGAQGALPLSRVVKGRHPRGHAAHVVGATAFKPQVNGAAHNTGPQPYHENDRSMTEGKALPAAATSTDAADQRRLPSEPKSFLTDPSAIAPAVLPVPDYEAVELNWSHVVSPMTAPPAAAPASPDEKKSRGVVSAAEAPDIVKSVTVLFDEPPTRYASAPESASVEELAELAFHDLRDQRLMLDIRSRRTTAAQRFERYSAVLCGGCRGRFAVTCRAHDRSFGTDVPGSGDDEA